MPLASKNTVNGATPLVRLGILVILGRTMVEVAPVDKHPAITLVVIGAEVVVPSVHVRV